MIFAIISPYPFVRLAELERTRERLLLRARATSPAESGRILPDSEMDHPVSDELCGETERRPAHMARRHEPCRVHS